ncbi:mechanosensitive ion channel domain-containing protein [Methylomicrobium sp. Wu6]|uniref:mechanosensitive ion channel domain-containing protein n=1 Tax=Methylomicrobium sp. Wu6 TaxID=3107928 RepID=UPI002DD6A251|nr:mechanosensitive ion channel domain-containing protein [Methylomicrobium sp. Wu6]MEC4747192.1 mechanosensitive ion channel [Methylomicrobium sp. Wu6]
MKINVVLTIILLSILGSARLSAETSAPAANPKELTSEVGKKEVRNKIDALNKRQGLDESLKTKVLAIYQEAEDNLDSSEKFAAQTLGYKASLKSAPLQARRLRKDIDSYQQKTGKQKNEDWDSIPTEELEQRLIIEKGKVANLDDQIKKNETELVEQNSRPQLIREEIVAAKQEIEADQKQLTAPTVGLSSPLESEARQIALKTAVSRRTAELKMLDAEALSNPARAEVLKVELQWLEIQRNELSPIIEMIDVKLAERRQKEAQQIQDALSQVEKELSGKHVLIQRITRENLQYTRDLQDIISKTEKYTEQKNIIDAVAVNIDTDFKSAEKKISVAGLSPALGRILREQRRSLANQDRDIPQSENLQNETAAASLEQFKVDDQLQRLENLDVELKEMMRSQVDQNLPVDQRMMIQAELRVLLNGKKDLLNKLSAAYAAYLRTLGDFDFARQQLETQIDKFAKFLDEHLLWVPSSEPINLFFFAGLYESVQWLLSPLNWLGVCEDLLHSAQGRSFLALLSILVLSFLPIAKRWAKAQLSVLLEKAEKIYTDNFNNGLQALVFTVVLVLPLPTLCYLLGWFLNSSWQAADFSKAVGAGLKAAAVPLWLVQFFYRLFAPGGIALKHFQWEKTNAHLMRKHLAWVRFIAVLGTFIVYSAGASKSSIYGDSLGRLALIIIMIAIAVFFSRILKPGEGLLKNHIQAYPEGWVSRLRYLWYPAVCLPPLIVVGFAVAGYYLSAVELQQKLVVTLRLAFGLFIVHEMVLRWLILANRQLAIKNARQKRKVALQSEKAAANAAGGEEPMVPIDEQLIDIPKINAQTIKLMNVLIAFGALASFGIIWRNILPAFSFLERIVLWQHVDKVDNQEVYLPITMANLLLAGLYVFVTVVAVRNFSGVMELLVFRRLSVEAGARYAVNQLATYALVAAGFAVVANELGGSWSQVQWLVAALGVGLGFGLQEIFANLVSGIILLFERPVRVGDTVTIGNVTGKVSRIQMRATTLIDWDQKELIVPNKTFITSQLINWSLTDAVTRVVIPIGIAYGSNVEEAHQLMLDTVKSTPLVLSEPEPSVLFVGFGENSLDFSIRIFVSELSHRSQATHNIHLQLEKVLREHAINIPFPQREVHIRSACGDCSSLMQEKRA